MTRAARTDYAHAVTGGVIHHLSVSQIATFSVDQYGGCERRWFYDKVLRLPQPVTFAQKNGVEVHGQIEATLESGVDTLGDIARAGVGFILPLSQVLPLGRTVDVELPFGEGEPPARDLVAAGVPLVGFIDVVNGSDRWVDPEGAVRPQGADEVEVLDWKTTGNLEYVKAGSTLVDTVQMPGYARLILSRDPGLARARLSHVYFQTKGRRDSVKTTALVPREKIDDRWNTIEASVRSMIDVAKETDAARVAPNRKACDAYRGCPFRWTCPRSDAEKLLTLGGTKMGLLDKLNNLGKAVPVPAAAASTPSAPAPVTTTATTSSAPTRSATYVPTAADAKRAALEERKRQIAAETAALEAEESAALAPPAPAPPPPDLKSGEGYMSQGGPQMARVNPPDAPPSVPPTSAAPVPPETLPTLSPVVQAAAAPFAAPAAGAPPAPAAGKKPRAAKPAPQAAPISFGGAPAAAVVFADTFALCGFPDLPSLDPWIDGLCDAIANEYGAADVRCAPDGTPLAFGKWKGALAYAVKCSPPAPGFYSVRGVRESEIKQTVLDALRQVPGAMIMRGA